MMRNFNASATPSTDLRRRHQARRDYSFHWDSKVPDDRFDCDLDLSVHRSSSPFTAPPPAVTRDREFHVSNSRRRPRNSRGTKEAKKRRDARRNRRKLTAHYLDEQLSKDIDETLNKANIRRPQPVSLPTPTCVLPTSSFWPPQPQQRALSARRSPSPFQLPPLDFNTFDVYDFPLLASPKQSPSLSPQPFLTPVPNWCPQIPCLTTQPKWSSSRPKFFDLSHLPEKESSPAESTGKELQLWREGGQRKQSRFFPRQPSPRPTIKLPSTYCTLHRSKIDANNVALTEATFTPRSRSISDAVRKIVAAVMAKSSTRLDKEPSAVNLWNILSEEVERKRHAHAGDRESSLEDDFSVAGGVPLDAETNEAYRPAELESNEIPYTHGNSLIGFANEVADLHSGTGGENTLLVDSALYLAEGIARIESEPTDSELAAMPGPQTPATPFVATSDPFPMWVEPDNNNIDSDDMTGSIAHYTREQQLFDVEPTKLDTTTGNTCDLEIFLSMGHVENCWCRDCEEEPELVNDEWSTPLTESDGWVMWSATEDESDNGSEPSVALDNNGQEEDGSSQTWTTGFDWDDFYPSMTPKSPAPELDDDFLGYCDDGAAFSHDNDKD